MSLGWYVVLKVTSLIDSPKALSEVWVVTERNYDREVLREESEILVTKMNEKQKFIYDLIVNASILKKQELVFVYGYGGTRKTFLWKCIITFLRSEGKIVLAVASSGIASLLLPAGRTAHSRFKLPIDLTDETVCNIKKNTHLGNLLKETELIVWDEAPMNDKKCFEALNRTLRDILSCEHLAFGENMRLQQISTSSHSRTVFEIFLNWLLDIGNGNVGEPDAEDPVNSSWINIPDKYLIVDDDNGIQNLISFIYNAEMLKNPTALEIQSKVIICPKNDDADMINNLIINIIEKPSKTYYSYNEAKPYGNDRGENLNLAGGLCNDTRMIVTQLFSTSVQAEIITGARVGEKVYIPKICLIHKEGTLPFILRRKQLPLKISYAMTLNKSQGQSFNKIGIYLPKPVFGHGQLYVALSRATSPYGLKILMKQHENHNPKTTKNIVFKDFLQMITNIEVSTLLSAYIS
ncbi:uncharacterized protein [Rutidosis leptorrhynchoides]|uniref:uncharacterized protein n=1 Tax=Rutidosis leptorrhynchoides TaxID=125765 RepID=UPI003A98D15B